MGGGSKPKMLILGVGQRMGAGQRSQSVEGKLNQIEGLKMRKSSKRKVNIMRRLTRKAFMKETSFAAAGFGLAAHVPLSVWAKPLGANDDIRVAVVGVRSRGMDLIIKDLSKVEGVRLVAVCDVDSRILNKQVEQLKDRTTPVKTYTDVRKLLEDQEMDVAVIATPNHWHALITVWACQAGMDVYVEKPVSHNVWEGRKMVEAARKYNRIVQVGTNARSNRDIPEVIQYIKEGNLGKILWVHALWYKMRDSIGFVQPYYPDWLDYDLFCGRAPMVPLTRQELHYDWHWKWDTGNGDLCNLGNHLFDVARWIAGIDVPPQRVMSLGGRFVVDDAGETPNTQLTVFDYPEIPIIMENRGLPMKPGTRTMDNCRGIREGVIVQCEHGYFAGYHGGWLWDNNGQRIKQFASGGGESHMQNFIDCVRTRKTRNLRAPIETGHISTSSCLYGNISYRLGKHASVEHIRKTLGNYPLAHETFARIEEHLVTHKVDPKKTPFTLGPWVTVDAQQEKITAVEGADKITLSQANFFLKDTYRPPYIIPEKV